MKMPFLRLWHRRWDRFQKLWHTHTRCATCPPHTKRFRRFVWQPLTSHNNNLSEMCLAITSQISNVVSTAGQTGRTTSPTFLWSPSTKQAGLRKSRSHVPTYHLKHRGVTFQRAHFSEGFLKALRPMEASDLLSRMDNPGPKIHKTLELELGMGL